RAWRSKGPNTKTVAAGYDRRVYGVSRQTFVLRLTIEPAGKDPRYRFWGLLGKVKGFGSHILERQLLNTPNIPCEEVRYETSQYCNRTCGCASSGSMSEKHCSINVIGWSSRGSQGRARPLSGRVRKL